MIVDKQREGRTREKRTLLTPTEDSMIRDHLIEVGRILGFRVNYSELCRAALTLVLEHEEKFFEVLRRSGGALKKPHTADLQASFEFEERIAQFLGKAIRRRR